MESAVGNGLLSTKLFLSQFADLPGLNKLVPGFGSPSLHSIFIKNPAPYRIDTKILAGYGRGKMWLIVCLRCSDNLCDHKKMQYHSCRNRHCPHCGNARKEDWIEARLRELLPCKYYHVVFTMPHACVPECRYYGMQA